MQPTPMNRIIQHLLASCGWDGAGMTDGELLTRFLNNRDDAALAALVRRHGPMVWSVCCRLLRSHHDAEDAFQATFVVLVQKAAALPDKETVGNWLYGVAHQTAVRMRAIIAKRGVRERQVTVMPKPATAEQYVWKDLKAVLDEELSRLPNRYRVLIVLCDLEGMTRKQVAGQLGIPEGTVASRLAAARAMLAKRLTRRGVVVSAALLGAVLSSHAASACVPMMVVSSTIKAVTLVAAGQAAAGVISPTVAALTRGVTKTMFVTKIKSVLAVVLLVGLVLGGAVTGLALFNGPAADAQSEPKKVEDKKVEPPSDDPKPKQKGKKAEAEIAWGKATEGLQAGIIFRKGEPDTFLPGQSVNFDIYLRNTGEKETSVSHIETLFEEWLPTVTDADGNTYKVLNGPLNLGHVSIVTRTLDKGQPIRLGTAWFVIVAPGTKGEAKAPTLVAPSGKYLIGLSGFPLRRPGNNSSEQKWATGQVELQIGAAK
jgi:RNA polymerase sigma factor (sigma-70 family)